ncbi:glutathione peroxidase [Aquabacterium sp.]|uniref:glutathione peroxidase n=1 Tax=Aquabacterium sp. TaxID=1872578 RepID=UPI0035B21793
MTQDLRTISVKTIDGQTSPLGDHLGKATLIVNVASKCGFTPQYKGLEALYRQFKDQGLVVLGFPCDQFGHQEPGDEAEIRNFCSLSYDVTFPMFAKIDVNGPQAHPVYQALKKAAPGILGTESIKWNFTKFLLDANGSVVDRYAPTAKPESLEGDIRKILGA